MFRFSFATAAATLAVAALTALSPPAFAASTSNSLTADAPVAKKVVANALTFNALAGTDASIASLNGVAVESVTLLRGLQR